MPLGSVKDAGRDPPGPPSGKIKTMERRGANPDLVEALRATATLLAAGADYRWTHMGRCNCGLLAQTVTGLPAAEIHRRALEKAGDWGEQARDYCPASGYPIDHVIGALLDLGLTREDLWHLERLSDPEVLGRLPAGRRELDCRMRGPVVVYLRAWADLVEEAWMATLDVPRRAPALEASSG